MSTINFFRKVLTHSGFMTGGSCIVAIPTIIAHSDIESLKLNSDMSISSMLPADILFGSSSDISSSQCSSSSSSKKEVLNDSLNLINYTSTNASKIEIDSALKILNNDPSIITKITGQNIPEKTINKVLNNIMHIVNDPNLIDSICENMKKNMGEHKKDDKLVDISYKSMNTTFTNIGDRLASDDAWRQLQDQFPCPICQDVLAGPILVSRCGHNFCGICIQNHFESCSVVDKNSDIAVAHNCPVCRQEIESTTFEITLNEYIKSRVDSIPYCEQKLDWEERMKKSNNKRLEDLFNRAKEDEEFMEDLIGYSCCCFIVLLSISIIIVASRSRK